MLVSPLRAAFRWSVPPPVVAAKLVPAVLTVAKTTPRITSRAVPHARAGVRPFAVASPRPPTPDPRPRFRSSHVSAPTEISGKGLKRRSRRGAQVLAIHADL